jgi:serine/threonine-protein kinase
MRAFHQLESSGIILLTMSDSLSVRRLHPGERLAKYEIVAPIARGGMGIVYEAKDVELGRRVALKVVATPDARQQARFQREALYAARLRHENIVALYDFGEADGFWYLALEFVEGVNLHEHIKRKGRLLPEDARRITIQACLALHHAHAQGIVHRDVKPANFLVARKNGRFIIKLSDLGLSRAGDDDGQRVTRTGTTVGTVDYMAPEQAANCGRADKRSDIYSLGCTLFHMLAGQPPFPGGAPRERMRRHVNEEPPDILQVNPLVPVALAAVLRRMLAKAREKRYQSAAAVLKDLIEMDGSPWAAFERQLRKGASRPAGSGTG